MQTPKRKGISDKDIPAEESGIVNANSLLHKLLKDFAPFAQKDNILLKLLDKYLKIPKSQTKMLSKLRKVIMERLGDQDERRSLETEILFTSLEGLRYMIEETGVQNETELEIILKSYKDELLTEVLDELDNDRIIIGDTPS